MTIDYRFGVDWDNDAFICWDATPGDPVNLVGHPVDLSANTLSVSGTGASISEQFITPEPWGHELIDWASGTSSNGYVQLGSFGDPLAAPVSANTRYTLVFWIRSESATFDAVPLRVELRRSAGFDGSIGFTGNFTVPFASGWVQQVVNFTTDSSAGYTGLYFRIQKNTSTTNASYDIGGIMVLQDWWGNSNPPLPAFNAGAVSLYDNITTYVKSARWNVGAREAYVAVADMNVLEIELNNVSKIFSPEYSSSPIFGSRANRRVEVFCYGPSSSAWTRMFRGYIEALLPTPGAHGPYTAVLIATSNRRFFEGKQVRINLQVSATAATVLSAIENEIDLPAGVALSVVHDSGTFTWPYAGDNWEDGTDALGAMTEVVQSERGFLYWLRNDAIAFLNRTSRYDSAGLLGLAATFDNAQEALDYRYGDAIYNDIEVVRYPRRASSSTTLQLWQLDETLTLASGEQYTMFVRYTDDANKTIGAVPGTVAESSFSASGSGVVRTLTPKANGCIILYNNTAGVTRNVTGHILTGQRITAKNANTINVEDAASIAAYGRKTLRLDLKQVAVKADAAQIGALELARHKDPRGRVVSITIGPRDTTHEQHMVDRIVFEKIRVIEDQTATDGEYMIIGESHEVSDALTHHRTTYFLEPAVDLL